MKPEEKDIEAAEQSVEEPAGIETEQPAEAGAAEVAEELDPVAKLEEELAEMKDRYLRQVAEFDNFRKRTIKEKTELILNGGEKVLTALLPVLDDMERARRSLETAGDVEALREGLTLVFDKLSHTLKEQGLRAIEAVGKDFDTDYHEAIAMIPAQEPEQKGRVIDCVQTGYMLGEKVLRHAKVAIGQ